MRIVRALATGASLLFFALNASGAGCYPESAFLCSSNENCTGEGGICEDNAYCSYPDLNCPGGRRWDERATSSLADMCFDVGMSGTDTDTDGDTDPMTGTTGGGSTTSTTTDPVTSTSSTTTDPLTSTTTTTTTDPMTTEPMTSSTSGSGDGSSTASMGACDAMYGGAADYELCEETETTCSFNATIGMAMSCTDVCTGLGGTCTGAELNDVELCTGTGAGTCDQMDVNDIICICSI